MREIKFRAWDIDCRRFEHFEIGENDDCYGMFRVAANKFGSVIEQYTGLKDKNGKEIYEGDIIQTQYMNAKGWVVWANGAWDIRLLKDTLVELFLAEEVGVGCEVIGNIHENPELLGGEND